MVKKLITVMMLGLCAAGVWAQESTPEAEATAAAEPAETTIGAARFTLPANWIAVEGQNGSLILTNTALENLSNQTYPAGTVVVQANLIPSYLLVQSEVATDLPPADLLQLTAGDVELTIDTITLGDREVATASRESEGLRSDLYAFSLGDGTYAIASSVGLDATALDPARADIETFLTTLTIDRTGDMPDTLFDYSSLPQGYSTDSFPMLGSSDATSKLVEISSFSCPSCYNFHAETLSGILELVAAGDTSFTYVPFFRAGSVGNGEAAALAAMCADQQQAFWPYHDTLFSWQKYGVFAFEQARLLDGAANLGLDVEAFTICLNDETSRPSLDAADAFTQSLTDFQGTPTLLLNGNRVVSGPIEAIQLAIATAQADEMTAEAPSEITPEATAGN